MHRALTTVAFPALSAACLLIGSHAGRSTLLAAYIVNGVETGDRLANVGMLVGKVQSGGGWRWLHCSGTLIADDVFLTAGHCVAPRQGAVLEWGVAFPPSIPIDQANPRMPAIPQDVDVYPGLAFPHPNFDATNLGTPEADSFDLAVIMLHAPVSGIRPARVVRENYFDVFSRTAAHLKIGHAGYGLTSVLPLLGLQPFDWGVRRVTTGRLDRVFGAKVVVGPDPGQICASDSGGPGFPTALQSLDGPVPGHVRAVAALTSFTLANQTARACETASILYRLDTPQARDFLGRFVFLVPPVSEE